MNITFLAIDGFFTNQFKLRQNSLKLGEFKILISTFKVFNNCYHFLCLILNLHFKKLQGQCLGLNLNQQPQDVKTCVKKYFLFIVVSKFDA